MNLILNLKLVFYIMKFKCVASTKDYVPVGLIIEGESISPLEFKVTKSAESVSPAFRKGAVVPMNGAFWTWQRDHRAEFADICEQGSLQ